MSKMLNLTLKVWRQAGGDTAGRFETYTTTIADDASFLEMLDYVNEDLIGKGDEPIAFDHDCREGICGTCGLMINGQAHGPQRGTATCQLHMRKFSDGDTIVIEPWRAAAFPIIKDLIVNRAAFDEIVQAGGYITVNTGAAPEANLTPVPKDAADAPWTLPRASVAARASPHVPTRQPSCSPRPNCNTSTCCPRARPSGGPDPRRWLRPWSSTSAAVPITASARRRVPGDLGRLHRDDEPRLPQGEARQPPTRRTTKAGLSGVTNRR